MKISNYTTGPIQANTYLVYDETSKKGFIVDPGGYDRRIIDEAGNNSLEIEYIILTHGHGDHIGGVAEFKRDFPKAKTVALAEEREMLQNPDINCSAELFGRKITVEADLWVKDGETLYAAGSELTFLATPGHTKGGMCIYTEGYLFSGDTLFRYSIGRTDFYGGDFRALINSIKDRIFLLPDDTVVLPGHMGKTTIGEEKRGNPFV